MPRYTRLIYPTEGLDLRKCQSRDPFRVRVFKTEDLPTAYYTYATSFFSAAHQLAKYLLEADKPNTSELDTFFFPLAFLYRHSMELLMKAIVFQYITGKEERISFIKDSFHNLSSIFVVLKAEAISCRKNDEMEWLEKFFESISKMDRESDSFRYPFHIGYEDELFGDGFYIKRVFDKQTHIDLIKFANKFEACFEILNFWYQKSNEGAGAWKNLLPQFIEQGGYYYGQSVVGYKFRRDDFYPYTHAYTEAACYFREYMKELFDEGQYDNAGVFFLPMCYLFRNCVELSQKAIWFEETGENLQMKCSVMMDCKHSVAGLWNHLESYIKACGTGSMEDNNYIALLKKYTMDLHSYDSDANRFRYPTNKEMEPYFHENKWFDFFRVADFFEAIINAYDGIDAAINANNEYKAEMQAEYCSEYSGDYW